MLILNLTVKTIPYGQSGLLLLVCLMGLQATPLEACKKARSDQVPHGANEMVLLDEQNVAHLRGTVLLHNDEPVNRAVVEVYRYEGSVDAYEITRFLKQTKRIAACLTGENGAFAFARLRPGRYLLRAGTVDANGINETHAIFKVTNRGKTEDLKIRLSLGT